MANICENHIQAVTTDAEWNEISSAFKANKIDWPVGGVDCYDRDKEIYCSTKWGPTPWEYMGSLGESYPITLFHYCADIEGEQRPTTSWFCNGEEGHQTEMVRERKQAYKEVSNRFKDATPIAAEGIKHRIERMPDGRVAADGENRFGECDILDWENIQAVACGNWHTVGLCEDGSVVACGSNANGQCDVETLPDKAIAVSCGQYHTAILLQDGRVIVRGKLEQQLSDEDHPAQRPFKAEEFPLVIELTLNKHVPGWEKMNERIERMAIGDEVALRKIMIDGETEIEVINLRGEKIGRLQTGRNEELAKILKVIYATVETVTPLSTRRTGSLYALMTLRLEYELTDDMPSNHSQSVTTANIMTWPPVEKIRSVFDAVIGMTKQGDIYVDGFCPCTNQEIVEFMKRA